MTNQEVFDLVNYIAGLIKKSIVIENFQFDLLLKRASLQRFKKLIGLPEEFFNGQPTTRSAWEVTQRISDIGRRFKVSTTLVPVTGFAPIPADYFYVTGINSGSGTLTRPVEILTDAEWGPRIGDPLVPATINEPLSRFLASTIELLPTSITTFDWTYLRKPTEPVYATKIENGITVYDSGASTELDWGDVEIQDIIALILMDVGVPVDPSSIEQYANAKKELGV